MIVEIKDKKVGIFIPEKEHRSTIPEKTRKLFLKKIEKYADKVYKIDVDFRKRYIKNGKVFVKNFCLSNLDLYIWYCDLDRSIRSYHLELLYTLSLTTKVFNDPNKFELNLDKYTAHLALQKAGARVPEFFLIDKNSLKYFGETFKKFGPLVLKPRRGSFGHGVTVVDSYEQLRDIAGYYFSINNKTPDNGIFLEKYYKNNPNKWISILMIDGEIQYGYRKKRKKFVNMGYDRFKVFDDEEIGGEVDLCKIPKSFAKEAFKAYKALETEIIGFDMIDCNGTPYIVDENTFPGFYEDLFKESNKDPSEIMFNFFTNQIKKIK